MRILYAGIARQGRRRMLWRVVGLDYLPSLDYLGKHEYGGSADSADQSAGMSNSYYDSEPDDIRR